MSSTHNNHFTAVEIWNDWTCIHRPTCKRHVGRVCDFNDLHLPPLCTVLQVVKTSGRVEGDIARDMDFCGGTENGFTTFQKDDPQAKLTFSVSVLRRSFAQYSCFRAESLQKLCG